MLKDITIGQYFPGKSLVHLLDSRVKLVLTIVFIVEVFLAGNALTMGLTIGAVLTLILISRVAVRLYLKSLKAVLPIIILTALLNAFFVEGDVLFKWGVIELTQQGLIRAVYMAVRIILLILISSMLTYTTTPNALTDAIESLLSPLKIFGLGGAVHSLAMMMTIALRFVPTLIEETDKIMSAQKARGADLESGGLMRRIKALLPILIPLLVSSFRRAAELAAAMECRCYTGSEGRTRLRRMHMAARDYSALIVSALSSATMPALLTRISICPNALTPASTTFWG